MEFSRFSRKKAAAESSGESGPNGDGRFNIGAEGKFNLSFGKGGPPKIWDFLIICSTIGMTITGLWWLIARIMELVQ